MHELSITENVMNIVKETVEKEGAKRVFKVKLKVGEFSSIAPDSVSFYFDILKKDTILKDAVLEIETIPLLLKCNTCLNEFGFNEGEELIFQCKSCNGRNVEICSGKELYIDYLEME